MHLDKTADVGSSSELDPELIIRVIIFEVTELMTMVPQHHGRTDGRTDDLL